MLNSINIFLDIDDVIFSWQECYADRFNTNVLKSWSASNLVKKRLEILRNDKDFWLNLKVKNIPNFLPKGYVSARSIPKQWTRESLRLNNIPGRSAIYQVPWGESKIELLKSLNCHIFIDDKVETFRECNKNGIFCLLMDAKHNKNIKTRLRINNLNLETILKMYHES